MHRILIANRGEIAVRVVRACRDMGLDAVAVYSDCDRAALHVRMADAAVAIGPNPPAESYLRIDRLVEAARVSGADAVHPGYGFLSENAAFASACRDAGLTFIGPTPEAIALMGNKAAARAVAVAAGVPVVPGTPHPLGADVPAAELAALGDGLGYPLMVKAVMGGGGRGLRLAHDADELAGAVRAARVEAEAAFGDPAIYLERRLERPRHIEVQLLADGHGTVVPFVERECSLQRRHQKIVEESPSAVVSPAQRAALTEAAVAIAREARYTNAGTIEFLMDDAGRFYFLEMNTRLQVEHPVTELVTGVDLVQWQIRLARGERLTLDPAQAIAPRGHAIECRVYAEDADAGFVPSPGRITALRLPAGPGIRCDSGVEAGGDVPIFYDPMVAKLVAWGEDRAQGIARMSRALDESDVHGVGTSLPFFRWLLRQPDFITAAFHTSHLDELLPARAGAPFSTTEPAVEEAAILAAVLRAARRGTRPIENRPSRWTNRARAEGLRG